MQKIDLNTFQISNNFYPKIQLLLTVKSFDLQAIRKRWLNSAKNKNGKAGSVERRTVAKGGIVAVTINQGRIEDSKIISKLPEPRGIDSINQKLAIATENKVFIFDGLNSYTIQNEWFSYIHTVAFSPFFENRILVTSSGLDCLFEIDYKKNKITREWFAWENGFNKAHNPKTNQPIILTRSCKEAENLAKSNQNYYFVKNPKEQHLPTAMRAAFINSVSYHPNNKNCVFATFFHEGAIFRINLNTGKATKVLGKLKNPHGGKKVKKILMATSTGSGEIVTKNQKNIQKFDFSKLNGKPLELQNKEWLQNSIIIGNHIITIDSNRNSFIIFSPTLKKLSKVSYNQNWAIQDMVEYKITSSIENKIIALGKNKK